MNEMKKILALLVCLLTISTGVRADDDRPVRFDQLPTKAQAYVKKYFPQEKVALAKMEKDFFDKKYEVILPAAAKWSSLRTELGKKWIASIPLFPKLSFPKPSYAM